MIEDKAIEPIVGVLVIPVQVKDGIAHKIHEQELIRILHENGLQYYSKPPEQK